MCTDCFEDDEDRAPIPAEDVTALARRIEAEMSGRPLPPRAWAVYLGQASGALDWKSLDRLARAMDAARLVAALAHAPRPVSSPIS